MLTKARAYLLAGPVQCPMGKIDTTLDATAAGLVLGGIGIVATLRGTVGGLYFGFRLNEHATLEHEPVEERHLWTLQAAFMAPTAA